MIHTAFYTKSIDFLKKSQNIYHLYDYLSDESQEVRYRIHEFLLTQYGYSGKLTKSSSGIPIPVILPGGERGYWSLSHTEKYVAYIFSDTPCGIDIIEHISRSEDLLLLHKKEEYGIVGGSLWDAFYIIWSAKEALIKKLSLLLDDMTSIEIVDCSISHNSCILRYMGIEHTVSYMQKSKFTLSYTFSF
ncbi:4'-phosphopantetheinyl transferase superfamily protein [Candidatus Gracilibacteria bacterium]|nr:4'-phosphopantetheinyl transferase superfamily protein [Candidatus Gracilibacteria bacterium]